MRLSAVRAQMERALTDRYPSPFVPAETPQPETVSTGIEEIDSLIGGWPRGRITGISGPESSGRTSLLVSALAAVTGTDEVSSVIDPAGAFDPASAATAGVDLDRLLWVRPGRDVDTALKVADLLVQGGGFGLIGVDLADLPATEVRRVSLSSWFRLQRAVENTPTILLFISREPAIETCAALALRLEPNRIDWSPRLFGGIRPKAGIVRSRIHRDGAETGASRSFRLPPAASLRAVAGGPIEVLISSAGTGRKKEFVRP